MRVQKLVQAINEAFGPADGTSTTYQLQVGSQPMLDPANVFVSSISQTDWQGTKQLARYARTNYSINSSNPAAWTKTAATAGTPIAAPDGTAGAFMLAVPSTSNVSHYVRTTAAVPANTPVVISFYAKAGGYTKIIPEQGPLGGTGGVRTFDLSAGTVSTGGGTATITAVPNQPGVYRCTLAFTTGAGPYTNGPALFIQAYGAFAGDGVSGVYVWGMQIETGQVATPYIATGAAAVTQTDYAYAGDEVSFGYVPKLNATFNWSGSADVEVVTAAETFLAQYAQSPILTALMESANAAIDPNADMDAFYSTVWNVYTAVGFGLDIWGRIVNVPRTINIPASNLYFGFKEGNPSFYPFNQEPFYAGPQAGTLYTLTDDAYRVLILTKALANISSFTAQSMNALLNFMFNGQGTTRGSCYVLELSPMQIEYVFNFALQSWEAAILQQSSLMPRPAGVGVTIVVNP